MRGDYLSVASPLSEPFFILYQRIYKSPIQSVLPARLSYFLIVLAIGTAVDPQQRSGRAASEKYHQLARAAVCESSVIDEPSTDVVNALMYMVWYLVVYSNRSLWEASSEPRPSP
ncbi:hypothetical protein A0H81_08407 [Grifola frondosa]|uniref:Uncharacterized protein n=1 Tax=Grifola frondosa TaxID=5627 RepID=A0A1C7M3K8_GRIFR|nr:hypothetical protein A0H81_08407 [Grifola frondosa]